MDVPPVADGPGHVPSTVGFRHVSGAKGSGQRERTNHREPDRQQDASSTFPPGQHCQPQRRCRKPIKRNQTRPTLGGFSTSVREAADVLQGRVIGRWRGLRSCPNARSVFREKITGSDGSGRRGKRSRLRTLHLCSEIYCSFLPRGSEGPLTSKRPRLPYVAGCW